MSTDPIVRMGRTPLLHTKVLWSQTTLLADVLDRAKESQRNNVRNEYERAEVIERGKMTSSKYRAYRKMMPRTVPGTSGDPLRQSPLTAQEISEQEEFTKIVIDMQYDRRISMLLAKACEEELRNIHMRLTSLQEVISKFIRMHPRQR